MITLQNGKAPSMDLKLKKKAVLVTGGTNGLGLRVCRTFADEGAHVFFCSIDPEERIREVEDELRGRGVKAFGTQGDVCDPMAAERIVNEAVENLGGIDILINNVGRRFGGGLFEATDQDWAQTFDNIVFQAVRMIKLTAPHMKERGGGSVVNISSVSGWLPQLAKGGQYSGAKSTLIFLAEQLALELVPYRVRINTLSPGSMYSPDGIWEKWRQDHPDEFESYRLNSFPMGRMGTPEEVADVVVFLASPRGYWINGRHIAVDGLQQPEPAPGYKTWKDNRWE